MKATDTSYCGTLRLGPGILVSAISRRIVIKKAPGA